MEFACSRCSAPHPMMVVLGILWLHHTRASRTLGWRPHWPHWTLGHVWPGKALTVHRGGICPTTNPNWPRVFGFISVGTSKFDYNNTCLVVVPPWASKAAASPQGTQGPHASCGAVGCEVLLDVSDDTTLFCVTCGNVPLCATHGVKGQCGACQEGAWNQGETMTHHNGVVWGRYPAPLEFYMPVDGATFFAIHENLSPRPLRVGVEGHPSYEECPLRQMHANPSPSMGSDGTFLACPPVHWWFRGGSLVVLLGFHHCHNQWGFALFCTWAQAPPHGCCTGGELRLGEVVAIQDRLKEEEVQAEAQAKVKEGQGEGRGRS